MDIRQSNTLNRLPSRDEKDQKHICPLQLDVIERCVALWSHKDDVVLSPFADIGSEVFVAVSRDRYAVGIELKGSYYDVAVRNCQNAERNVQIQSVLF